ncbi:unnamed protein product [Ambrosiozyma monospora]|uniref:Unnamed protein product n=1 Tax=Ambrosiozyma monospora TaxID=43982 RepID=A0A9W6YRW4_AMBMO|nr:unnamed protein product [Ambrosiozyma monospora]
MRRRTASHNVNRIPKRLRKKALREMGLTLSAAHKNAKQLEGKETKGVKENGKPAKKKHARGKQLYQLRRRVKLLKYAAKLKLQGKLPSGELVSAGKINMRQILKSLKDEIKTLEFEKATDVVLTAVGANKDGEGEGDATMDDAMLSPFQKEQLIQKKQLKKLNNYVGSYDNTGINSKAKIHKLTSLSYATRQKKFKWLPTHMWQAKRSKIVKRWGWNLVYTPTQKCFRNTSRMSRLKGCLAWDTSYVNTAILNCHYGDDNGADEKIKVLKKIVGQVTNGAASRKKVMKTGSFWEGYFQLDSEVLCHGQVFWNTVKTESGEDSTGSVLQAVLRIHPSVYDQIMDYLLKETANFEFLTLHDCKYSIGSIKLSGPKALSSLQSLLYVQSTSDNEQQKNSTESESYKFWRQFANLNDTTTLPSNIQFAFHVDDPRLVTRPLKTPRRKTNANDILDSIIALKQSPTKAIDAKAMNNLLSFEGRYESYNKQASLKQLGRERRYNPGVPVNATQSSRCIPVIINKSTTASTNASTKATAGVTSYEVIMPWFWIMSFWYQLMHIPHVLPAGLKQWHQLQFEKGVVCGAGCTEDEIFTRVGYGESLIKMQENERKWLRRPVAKRVAYDKLVLGVTTSGGSGKQQRRHVGEVGSPFGCDWRYLQLLRGLLKTLNEFETDVAKRGNNNGKGMMKGTRFNDKLERVINSKRSVFEAIKDIQQSDKLKQKKSNYKLEELPITLLPVKTTTADTNATVTTSTPPPPTASSVGQQQLQVKPIHFKCVSTGHIKDNARIYQIPSASSSSISDSLDKVDKEHLIGFVTSATFNLTQGGCTGVGFIDAGFNPSVNGNGNGNAYVDANKMKQFVLVRNIGSASWHLAEYNVVDIAL